MGLTWPIEHWQRCWGAGGLGRLSDVQPVALGLRHLHSAGPLLPGGLFIERRGLAGVHQVVLIAVVVVWGGLGGGRGVCPRRQVDLGEPTRTGFRL